MTTNQELSVVQAFEAEQIGRYGKEFTDKLEDLEVELDEFEL